MALEIEVQLDACLACGSEDVTFYSNRLIWHCNECDSEITVEGLSKYLAPDKSGVDLGPLDVLP